MRKVAALLVDSASGHSITANSCQWLPNSGGGLVGRFEFEIGDANGMRPSSRLRFRQHDSEYVIPTAR